jgi:hypothetical protein
MLQYGFQAKLDIQLGCIFIKDNGRLKIKNKKKKKRKRRYKTAKTYKLRVENTNKHSIHNKWTAVVAFRAICINNYLPNLFPKI